MALSLFGFYNGFGEQTRDYSNVKLSGDLVYQIGLFHLTIQPNGELSGLLNRALIDEARKQGIQVYLILTNRLPRGQFSTSILTRIIQDEVFSSTFVKHLRNILNTYTFDGVIFDFKKVNPLERKRLTKLLFSWTNLFKQENYLVAMDLPAKTMEEAEDLWKEAYDYQALGQIVDFILLMPDEEYWPIGSRKRVSLPWVSQALNYALELIPPRKVHIGIPVEGYDWEEGGKGKVISYRKALELSKCLGAPMLWDNQQRCTFYRYETMGKRHLVYFEDPRSLAEKLDCVQRHQIRGVAIRDINRIETDFRETLFPFVLTH